MQQVLSGKMSYSSFSVDQGFDSQQQLLHQNSRKTDCDKHQQQFVQFFQLKI